MKYFLKNVLFLGVLFNQLFYVSSLGVPVQDSIVIEYDQMTETEDKTAKDTERSKTIRKGILNPKDHFGQWSISKELFFYIRRNLKEGSTILELGSGWGTSQLCKYYKVYSVEHNKAWVGKYKSTYIFAPINNNWYDVNILKNKLPSKYDLILVDGPPGGIGRYGFFENLILFKNDVPIIIDDVNRDLEYKLLLDVAKFLDRHYEIIHCLDKKSFGVINLHRFAS